MVQRCMVRSSSMSRRITSLRDCRCQYRGVGGARQPVRTFMHPCCHDTQQATRVICGAAALSSLRRFPSRSALKVVVPVMFSSTYTTLMDGMSRLPYPSSHSRSWASGLLSKKSVHCTRMRRGSRLAIPSVRAM